MIHFGNKRPGFNPSVPTNSCLTLLSQPLPASPPSAGEQLWPPKNACVPERGVCTRRTATMKIQMSTRTQRCTCCQLRRPGTTATSRPCGAGDTDSSLPPCPSHRGEYAGESLPTLGTPPAGQQGAVGPGLQGGGSSRSHHPPSGSSGHHRHWSPLLESLPFGEGEGNLCKLGMLEAGKR